MSINIFRKTILIKRTKTLVRVFLLIGLFITISFPLQLKAQEVSGKNDSGTIQISPAITYLKQEGQFELIIKNNTAYPFNFALSAAYFDLDLEERSVTRAENLQNLNTIFDIEISNMFRIIEAGDVSIIPIRYKGTETNYIPAIIISQINNTDEYNVGVSTQFASLIIDQELDSNDKLQVYQDLEVIPNSSVLGVSFSNKFTIKSTFENRIQKLLKVSGEIVIKKSDTYLENYGLSQYLLDPLFPEDKKDFEYEFVDNRSFLKRFGTVKFEQNFIVNGEQFTTVKEIFVLPTEFIIIGLVSLLILTFLYIHIRRKSKIQLVATQPNSQLVNAGVISPSPSGRVDGTVQ